MVSDKDEVERGGGSDDEAIMDGEDETMKKRVTEDEGRWMQRCGR